LGEIVVDIDFAELLGGEGYGFEEGVGNAGNGGGGLGRKGAIGDTANNAGEGLRECVSRNEAAGDGLEDVVADRGGVDEARDFAIVVQAEHGAGGMTRHATVAAVGGCEGAGAGSDNGGFLRHKGSRKEIGLKWKSRGRKAARTLIPEEKPRT
jgi:hypothetical protein